VNIFKQRGIAKSVVAESVGVVIKRKCANSTVESPLPLKRSVCAPLAVFRVPLVLSKALQRQWLY
jgi:hypothetical protein